MRNGIAAAAGAVLISVSVAGCGGEGLIGALGEGDAEKPPARTGEPSAEPTRQGPPKPEYLRGLPVEDDDISYFLKSDKALTVDPCALHDTQAAEEITGLGGSRIEPGSDFTRCTVHTGDRDVEAWSISLEVGKEALAEGVDNMRDGKPSPFAEQVTIAGEQFDQHKTSGQCNFDYDGKAPVPISMYVAPDFAEGRSNPELNGKSCAMGRDYIESVIDTWRAPPKREDGASQHTIAPLGSPCAAMRHAFENVSALPETVGSVVDRGDPGWCRLNDELPRPGVSTPMPEVRASVQFMVDADPAEPGNLEKLTVAGQPATKIFHENARMSSPPNCQITVRLSDKLIPTEPTRAHVAAQAVVKAPNCAEAKDLATVVVHKASE